ncbi:hypothetical protein IG631_03367 [Alternaria alternata]|nr:hypothetical protein IG631_03367 [Alternaria alternata]
MGSLTHEPGGQEADLLTGGDLAHQIQEARSTVALIIVVDLVRNDWSERKPTREIEWTRAITMDLDELAQSTTTPVLLSIGADGFTCNSLLMREWLKERARNFIFAVTHDNESTLDTDYLTPVDESYVTTYDLRMLSRQSSDKQDPRHVDLTDYWDRLQSTKNGVSKNIRTRNQAPRDRFTGKRG